MNRKSFKQNLALIALATLASTSTFALLVLAPIVASQLV